MNIVKTRLSRGFPYKLNFEERQEEDWILTLKEGFEDSIMWSNRNSREVMEILGCIVERGGFDEDFQVNSESRSYIREGFRRIPEEDISSFRKVLEASVRA